MTRFAFTDEITDLRDLNDSASPREIADFAMDIAGGAVKGVLRGFAGTAADPVSGCARLCTGDFSGAAAVACRRADAAFAGILGTIESGAAIADAGYEAIVHDVRFVTDQNREHLTRLCQAGIYAAAAGMAGSLADEGAPEGTSCTLTGDACSLPGVENGVFTGNADDLEALAAAGEMPDAEHAESEAALRSSAARAAFLNAHGIEDTAGWEVHHILPVSMGGADVLENMVLIDPESHNEITAEHADYYGWHRK